MTNPHRFYLLFTYINTKIVNYQGFLVVFIKKRLFGNKILWAFNAWMRDFFYIQYGKFNKQYIKREFLSRYLDFIRLFLQTP